MAAILLLLHHLGYGGHLVKVAFSHDLQVCSQDTRVDCAPKHFKDRLGDLFIKMIFGTAKNVGIAAQGKILSPRNRDGGTIGTRQNDDKK